MKILRKIIDRIWKIKITSWWQLGCFFIKNKQPADLAKQLADGQIKNILISEMNFIGDKLFITPAIKTIKKQFPKINLTVLVKNDLTKSILLNNPDIDNLLIAPTLFKLTIFALKNRGQFDLLIDYSANLYYAFILTLAKIPYRLGTKPKQKILFKNRDGFNWLYTHTKSYSQNTYIADYFLGLLEFLGIKTQDNQLEIYLYDKEKQAAHSLLKNNNLFENQFLILHPGVKDQGRAWALNNWQILAQKLTTNHTLVFTGSADDQELIQQISQVLEPKQVLNLAGKLSVRETAALISLAQGFIGVDTGPLHMAVAFNKPIVAIFNTTRAQNYLPAKNNIIALSTPEKCRLHFTLDYIKTKKQHALNECSQLVKPEQVYHAVEKLLK
jgi:ADP-heptose:LPS heptosyltransferase